MGVVVGLAVRVELDVAVVVVVAELDVGKRDDISPKRKTTLTIVADLIHLDKRVDGRLILPRGNFFAVRQLWLSKDRQ